MLSCLVHPNPTSPPSPGPLPTRLPARDSRYLASGLERREGGQFKEETPHADEKSGGEGALDARHGRCGDSVCLSTFPEHLCSSVMLTPLLDFPKSERALSSNPHLFSFYSF